MKRKVTISVIAMAFLVGIGLKLSTVVAEDAASEGKVDPVADVEKVEEGEDFKLFWDTPATPGAEGVAEENPPLTQEEYDDLIRRLPKGARLVGDIKVMPGVVKDPTKETPMPD
ncbi:hypothetical protein [Pseudolactococcus reticulitermitis]|uniref:Uncharacterized protein n=1 Tax=Pseudolactococcus reticulitermitis TaxID=2025039 RepID=A0A224XEP6_9LACT|nr:hypothetical protein [Lactococcus reticulitermitis]GAX48051.1 hypothetical protein RsY01_1665 [Lactococcus reticulitermitis]